MSDTMRIITGPDTTDTRPSSRTPQHTREDDRPHVLIVDDEIAICRAVMGALQREGYRVSYSVSGDSAHEMLRTTHYDALILDLRVPDMRGDVTFHLATSVQPQLAYRTMFLTGDVTPEGRRMIAECGAPMVRKPYVVDHLVDTLVALCPIAQVASA